MTIHSRPFTQRIARHIRLTLVLAAAWMPLAGAACDADAPETQSAPAPVVGELGAGIYHCAAASSYAGCPEEPPQDDTTCELPGSTQCDYKYVEGSFQGLRACSCVPGAPVNRWHCSNTPIGAGCPATAPQPGSSCDAAVTTDTCPYLRAPACTCPEDQYAPWLRTVECHCQEGEGEGRWACGSNPDLRPVGAFYPDWAVPASEAASSPTYCAGEVFQPTRPAMDETTLARDLSDAQAAVWCSWYLHGATVPETPPYPGAGPPIAADGWGLSVAYSYDTGEMICVPQIPIAYCSRLLRVPACDAPVAALTDCYLSIMGGRPFGSGCVQWASHPGCRSAVLQIHGDCSLPPF